MATKKVIRKRRVRPRSRLTIDLATGLKRRLKVAATVHHMTMSAYMARVLEQALPAAKPGAKTSDGIVTSSMIKRAEALRKQQKEPFLEDSTDLIREAREQRYAEL